MNEAMDRAVWEFENWRLSEAQLLRTQKSFPAHLTRGLKTKTLERGQAENGHKQSHLRSEGAAPGAYLDSQNSLEMVSQYPGEESCF